MLKVSKQEVGGKLIVTLEGSIDEGDDLGKLIGNPTGALTVVCSGVNRINSIGVKGWIRYFQAIHSQRLPLRFEVLSSALVEQLNVVKNFACGGIVTSVMVPFACETCQTRLNIAMTVDELLLLTFPLKPTKCTKCGNPAGFDDIEEEYFAFVDRLS